MEALNGLEVVVLEVIGLSLRQMLHPVILGQLLLVAAVLEAVQPQEVTVTIQLYLALELPAQQLLMAVAVVAATPETQAGQVDRVAVVVR